MTFRFVAGDTASKLRVACVDDATGLPVDLTNTTVTLRWKPKDGGAVISKEMSKIVPHTGGIAEYQFATAELFDPEMDFEVRITDSGGKVLHNLNLIKEPVRAPLA
jgi:hypothetical protein